MNDKSVFEWLSSLVFIKDEEILRKRGVDAIQFLMFERYILYLLIVTTIISLVFILPINLIYGHRLDDRELSYYQKTTLLNIRDDSKVIYIHALSTIVIAIAVRTDTSLASVAKH